MSETSSPIELPHSLIRPATPADAEALARIHVDTWKSDYRGIVPDDYLAALSVNNRGDLVNDEERRDYRAMIQDTANDVFVAEQPHAGVVAFSAGGPFRDRGYRLTGSFAGELYYVYVDTRYRERGLGTDLVKAVAGGLLNRGVASMMVWVFEGYRAASLYERLGGKVVGRREVTLGGKRLSDIAYGWKDLNVIIGGR
jgi:ribosomal protein S18 acetylase RimI-like enzyme